MKPNLFIKRLVSIAAILYFPHAAACTGISLETTEGGHVQARTIEWSEFNLNSELVIAPKNYHYQSIMPDKSKGLAWQSTYGFVGISVADPNYIGEGINEKGLNAGMFYFKNYGDLAPFNPKNNPKSIADMDMVRWLLSNFATVEEVKKAINNIILAPVMIENGKPSPTAHWRVADALGANIVIEITDGGKVNIYDNDANVLTNAPEFPWHITHLNNFIAMKSGAAAPKKINDVDAFSFGVGSASVGLPGDTSPPSRFVRAAFYLNTMPKLTSSTAAISKAFHILNNFDLPIGSQTNPGTPIADMPSGTQWTAASDQTNKVFYFKTMYDSRIKQVDLKQLNFTQKKQINRPIDQGEFVTENLNLGI